MTNEKSNTGSVEEMTNEKRNSQSLEEKMDAIKKLFGPEIDAQSISIATVREKICLDPILCNEDVRQNTGPVAVQSASRQQAINSFLAIRKGNSQ